MGQTDENFTVPGAEAEGSGTADRWKMGRIRPNDTRYCAARRKEICREKTVVSRRQGTKIRGKRLTRAEDVCIMQFVINL